jgi:hypothetical protein
MTTDQTSPPTSVGVLAHSGKVLDGGLSDLRKSLASYGFDNPPWYEVPKSRFAPKSAKKLLNDGVDVVLVWGGDGMVQQAIDAFAGKDVCLGILPAGTANLFARNLDIPVDLEGAVKVAIQGERRQLDIGKINGEHFGVMAGAGLDALMIDDADGTLKDTFGRMTYVWTGAKNVHKKPVSTTVRVDGKKWFNPTDRGDRVSSGRDGWIILADDSQRRRLGIADLVHQRRLVGASSSRCSCSPALLLRSPGPSVSDTGRGAPVLTFGVPSPPGRPQQAVSDF